MSKELPLNWGKMIRTSQLGHGWSLEATISLTTYYSVVLTKQYFSRMFCLISELSVQFFPNQEKKTTFGGYASISHQCQETSFWLSVCLGHICGARHSLQCQLSDRSAAKQPESNVGLSSSAWPAWLGISWHSPVSLTAQFLPLEDHKSLLNCSWLLERKRPSKSMGVLQQASVGLELHPGYLLLAFSCQIDTRLVWLN